MWHALRVLIRCLCVALCGGILPSFATEPQRDEFPHFIVGASAIDGDADLVLNLPNLPVTLDRVDYSGHAVFLRVSL
jgi:hypothetical protein